MPIPLSVLIALILLVGEGITITLLVKLVMLGHWGVAILLGVPDVIVIGVVGYVGISLIQDWGRSRRRGRGSE